MANDPDEQSNEVQAADDHAGAAEYRVAMRYISSLNDGEGSDMARLNSEYLTTGGPPPKKLIFKTSGYYPKNVTVNPGANSRNWQNFNWAGGSHAEYPLGHVPYPPTGVEIEWFSPEDPKYTSDDNLELRTVIHHPTPRRDAIILTESRAIDPTTPIMLPQTKEQLLQQTEEALSFNDDQIFYPVGGKNLPRSPTGSNENRSRNRATHPHRKQHSQVMGTPTPGGITYNQTPTPGASANGHKHCTWSTTSITSPDSAASSTPLHTSNPLDSWPTMTHSKKYPTVKRITTGSNLKLESPAFTSAEPYTPSPDSTSSSKTKGDCIRFGTVAQSSNTVHHGRMQPNNVPGFQARSVPDQRASMLSGFQTFQANSVQSSFGIMNTSPSENFSTYLQYPSSYTSQYHGSYLRDISRVGSTGSSRGVSQGKNKRPKKYPQYPSSSELAFNFSQAQQ